MQVQNNSFGKSTYTAEYPSDLIEASRRIRAFNLFSAVGATFLLLFGVNALLDHRELLAYSLLGLSALACINALALNATKNYRLACNGATFIISLNFLLLIVTGGVDNTGPLWCFVFAPLILFIQGGRRGLIITAAQLSMVCVVFYYPDNALLLTQYSAAYKFRFLASYLDVTLMAFLYEQSRHRAYTQLKTLSQQMYKASRTDALTNLTNRRAMLEILESEHARAVRHNHPYTLILADLDRFKSINDTRGHICGDKVLVEVTELLRHSLRKQDVVARWGGEEFLILLPELGSADAGAVAEKIRAGVQKLHIACAGKPIELTISLGVHTADLLHDYNTYIKKADENLYQAKHAGRNRVVVSTEAPQARPEPTAQT